MDVPTPKFSGKKRKNSNSGKVGRAGRKANRKYLRSTSLVLR